MILGFVLGAGVGLVLGFLVVLSFARAVSLSW
jgi:hypothetical protein